MLKKEFSLLRQRLKMMRNEMDIYDEIAANFLNLNEDIDVLNRNQEKITNFIHENLEYNEKNKKPNSDRSISHNEEASGEESSRA